MAKITDFGLARDKADDDNMTGCGSVLWMAPEILLGEPYTEKVDVFSYAMVLVEMIDQKLPWTGVASGAEVPFKVTRAQRPENQLRKREHSGVAALVKECWAQVPSRRPAFEEICERLRGMQGGAARSRPASPEPSGSE